MLSCLLFLLNDVVVVFEAVSSFKIVVRCVDAAVFCLVDRGVALTGMF